MPKPLSFPVAFPDVPPFLLEIDTSREAASELLGPPNLTSCVDGLGDADFWAIEYECGLQVVFQFFHHGTSGVVLADSPEVQHVARHIPFHDSACKAIDDATLNSELEFLLRAYPGRKTEIELLHGFQVWRQDDNCNTFKVGNPTSERDASCWVSQLQALGHKQTYWYERI